MLGVDSDTVGPSPRGWGERLQTRPLSRWQRTIPTRVGRTMSRPEKASIATDHPHAGGETYNDLAQRVLNPGPSPRGWGERAG